VSLTTEHLHSTISSDSDNNGYDIYDYNDTGYDKQLQQQKMTTTTTTPMTSFLFDIEGTSLMQSQSRLSKWFIVWIFHLDPKFGKLDLLIWNLPQFKGYEQMNKGGWMKKVLIW